MSYNLSEETKKEALQLMKATQEAGVSESVRRSILQLATNLISLPEGLDGQIEMALHIDRRTIVVEKLREIATTIEKGFNA